MKNKKKSSGWDSKIDDPDLANLSMHSSSVECISDASFSSNDSEFNPS